MTAFRLPAVTNIIPGAVPLAVILGLGVLGVLCAPWTAAAAPGAAAGALSGETLSSAPTGVVSSAAPTGAVFGRVYDDATGQPLEGCRARIFPGDTSAVTDSAGRFRLAGLPPGTYRAVFLKSGYEPAEDANVVVGAGREEELVARLSRGSRNAAVELPGMTARARGETRVRADAGAGTFRYGRNDVLRAPGGFQDISMYAQTLPGVTRTNDQNTDLAVRGGGPDENAYLIDGIPIFSINHFENSNRASGAIGNINTYFLDGVEFHTGAFPARYPDRLSSVMDISFKRGSPSQLSGMGTADMAGIGGLLEGPLPGGGGTYGATARLSALTFLDRVGLIDFGTVPRYGNGHVKLNSRAGSWDLSLNVLGGADAYDYRNPGGIRGLGRADTSLYRVVHAESLYTENVFAGLRATRGGGRGRFSLYAAGNLRGHRFVESEEFAPAAEGSGPWDGLKTRYVNRTGGFRVLWGADADRILSPRWTVRVGLLHDLDRPELVERNGFRGVLRGADTSTGWSTTRSTAFYTLAGYAEAEWKSGPWEAVGGMRLFYDEYAERAIPGPRASVGRRLGDDHALKASFGLHTQSPAATAYRRYLPPGGVRLPYNVQSVLGWDAAWPLGLSTRVELFDKESHRLLRSRPDGGVRDTGRAYSRGVDVYVRKALRSKAWGSAAYTFAWNRVRRGGGWEPYVYSVPHTFAAALGYDLGRRFTTSVKLGLASGSPYTPLPRGATPADIDPALRYSATTDPYFRLDARAEYRHAFARNTLGVFLEINNITDHENLFSDGEYELEAGWGFLPIGGLTLSF